MLVLLKKEINNVCREKNHCPYRSRSGFKLQIFSGVLQKEITLGAALSWEEVQLIVNNGLNGEYLRSVITAKEIFGLGAFIESVEPVNTEDNSEDLLTTAA